MSKIKTDDYLVVNEGDELTFDVLTWQHEGYQFGRPCLMLSPVIREDSDRTPSELIESVLIGVGTGKLYRNNQKAQIDWRGWNLKTLRCRFNEALRGKDFPVAGYEATRVKVVITKAEYGLAWTILDSTNT